MKKSESSVSPARLNPPRMLWRDGLEPCRSGIRREPNDARAALREAAGKVAAVVVAGIGNGKQGA